MSNDNVSNLPENVHFDLDAAQRDPSKVKPKWRTRVGGRVIEFDDPETLDWRDLLQIEEPVGFLRYSCSEEDRLHIMSLRLEAWQLNELMEAYQRYFGFEDKVAEAKRKARLQGLG